MNTKSVGDIGEKIAVDTLIEAGYRILERNAVYCDCEVDIICDCYLDDEGNIIRQKSVKLSKLLSKLGVKRKQKGERVIVFCEVKTRYDDNFGSPEEAVTPYKVGRYVTAMKSYLKTHRLSGTRVRFDIFAVDSDGCRHIVDAFNENDAKYPRNAY